MAENQKKVKSIRIEVLEDDSFLLDVEFERPKETKELSPPNYREYNEKCTAQTLDDLKKKLDKLIPGFELKKEDKIDSYLGQSAPINEAMRGKVRI